jgi:N-acylneuraminate cytidylyltransferase
LNSDGHVARRQEALSTYVLNEAVYVVNTNCLRETEPFLSEQTLAHMMLEERSADVNTALDLEWCSFLAEEKILEGAY